MTVTGAALLVLGVGLLAAELAVASGGLLAAAGTIALAAAGLLLYDTDSDALAVSLPAAAAAGAGLGAFTVFGLAKALRARAAPARGGPADLVGAYGLVQTPLAPEGLVLTSGDRWRARTAADGFIAAGERVRVDAVAGLTLYVRRDEALADKEDP